MLCVLVCLQWSSQACRSTEWRVSVLPSSALDKQPEGKLQLKKSHLIQHTTDYSTIALECGTSPFKESNKTFSEVVLYF